MAVLRDSATLSVISYNLHGLGQGQFLLHDLCNRVDPPGVIMFTTDNLFKLNLSPKYTVFGGSAMDKATSNSVVIGRPFGGVAIMVRSDLARYATCLITNDCFIVLKLCGT